MSEVTNFSNAVEVLVECAEENGIEIDELKQKDNIQEIKEILKSTNSSRTDKKKQISTLMVGNDKQKKALAGLVTGCTVKLSELFEDKSLDEEERNKVSFSDSNYEEYISQIESVLADRFLLITAAKAIFDWSVLSVHCSFFKCP